MHTALLSPVAGADNLCGRPAAVLHVCAEAQALSSTLQPNALSLMEALHCSLDVWQTC